MMAAAEGEGANVRHRYHDKVTLARYEIEVRRLAAEAIDQAVKRGHSVATITYVLVHDHPWASMGHLDIAPHTANPRLWVQLPQVGGIATAWPAGFLRAAMAGDVIDQAHYWLQRTPVDEVPRKYRAIVRRALKQGVALGEKGGEP